MTEQKMVPVDAVLCLLNEIVNFRSLDKATDFDLQCLNRAIEIIIESTAPPRVADVDLLKMLIRIRDDKTWRTNDNSLWPDLLALIRKHESALEKP